MDAQALEVLKALVPLASVVLGGGITWRSVLRAQALQRRQEARAALVGAIEESISATIAFRDDLSSWQMGGWGMKDTKDDPRIGPLTTQIGVLKRAMTESRGRVAAARARLLALSGASEDLREAIALADAVLGFGVPGRASESELPGAERSLRERTLALAEGWRSGKSLNAPPTRASLESADQRTLPSATPTER
jgi:hypothetical protein